MDHRQTLLRQEEEEYSESTARQGILRLNVDKIQFINCPFMNYVCVHTFTHIHTHVQSHKHTYIHIYTATAGAHQPESTQSALGILGIFNFFLQLYALYTD